MGEEEAVSYTHLDVYKRQEYESETRRNRKINVRLAPLDCVPVQAPEG